MSLKKVRLAKLVIFSCQAYGLLQSRYTSRDYSELDLLALGVDLSLRSLGYQFQVKATSNTKLFSYYLYEAFVILKHLKYPYLKLIVCMFSVL